MTPTTVRLSIWSLGVVSLAFLVALAEGSRALLPVTIVHSLGWIGLMWIVPEWFRKDEA